MKFKKGLSKSRQTHKKDDKVVISSESENLRKESKITVPNRNEAAITSIQTNMADEVEIRHTVPKSGGFAEFEKKGLKIKNYHTTEKE